MASTGRPRKSVASKFDEQCRQRWMRRSSFSAMSKEKNLKSGRVVPASKRTMTGMHSTAGDAVRLPPQARVSSPGLAPSEALHGEGRSDYNCKFKIGPLLYSRSHGRG